VADKGGILSTRLEIELKNIVIDAFDHLEWHTA
jgi:hypothetical protein